MIIDAIFRMFLYSVLCTKHPAFKEEREWRIMYSPAYPSEVIEKEVEVIRGVPQLVCKIPLADIPDRLVGASLPGLVNRVIIGPTQYPRAIRDALLQQMVDAEIPDAQSKIWVSGVPLRQ